MLASFKLFFSLYLLKAQVMIHEIIEWDERLFLLLNGKYVGWLDYVMVFLSSYLCWVLSALLMLTFVYLKSDSWKKMTALFFAMTVAMSALITNIIKPIIARPRPIHNEEWDGVIRALEGTSDMSYSFFSSHSATTFSMAVFFFLIVRKLKLSLYYGWAAILWAAAVAYSRIYVAKHYPLDVLCGTLFGIMMGIVGYRLLLLYQRKKDSLL